MLLASVYALLSTSSLGSCKLRLRDPFLRFWAEGKLLLGSRSSLSVSLAGTVSQKQLKPHRTGGWGRRLASTLSGSFFTCFSADMTEESQEANGSGNLQENGDSGGEGMKDVWKEALKRLEKDMAELQKPDLFSHRPGFDEAFDKLYRTSHHRSASSRAMEAAFMPANEAKNRYCDVLPYDRKRVRLGGPQRSASDGSDYINASHIHPGMSAEAALVAYPSLVLPEYIATQGPLDSTIGDFWEMAQQQRCAAVIMLCKEVECGKSKCAHYFPEASGETEVFQNMQVTTSESSLLEADRSIIHRTLKVEDLRDKSKISNIPHFQYADWPDHGVPERSDPIRHLIRHLQSSSISSGPFIIHCSAGIGRTGTFICIDYTLRRVLAGDVSALDIPSTIADLRLQRAGMVQTREQFRFCYNAVLEELRDVTK